MIQVFAIVNNSLNRRFSSEGHHYSFLPISAYENLRENGPEIDAALELKAIWLSDQRSEPTIYSKDKYVSRSAKFS